MFIYKFLPTITYNRKHNYQKISDLKHRKKSRRIITKEHIHTETELLVVYYFGQQNGGL